LSFIKILNMDVIEAMKRIPNESVDLIVSSPPYWGLRDYGVDGQWGLEEHPQGYINKQVMLFREFRRVLKPTGSVFWNVGDSYYTKSGSGRIYENISGDAADKTVSSHRHNIRGKFNDGKWLQPKQLMLIPSRLAIALQDDGWILRNDNIWAKPNPMPSPVKDRFTNTYEHIFHFVKQRKYYFDLDAVREEYNPATIKRGPSVAQTKMNKRETHTEHELNPIGKNPGDVWRIATKPYKGAHFAVFPIELVERPIKACVPDGGVVLDPFAGSGTVGTAVRKWKPNASIYLIELNPDYIPIIKERVGWGQNGLGEDIEFELVRGAM